MEHQQLEGQSAHGSTCTVDTLPTAQKNGNKLDDVKKEVFEVAAVDVSGSLVRDTPDAVDDQTNTEAPYHVFTIRKKWQVVLIGVAGWAILLLVLQHLLPSAPGHRSGTFRRREETRRDIADTARP